MPGINPGEQHWCHKVTEEMIRKIRKLRKEGLKLREIKEICGLSLPQICKICNKQSWISIK